MSSTDQVEGYSLAAQERAIQETCTARGFELQRIYRDEGLSAHTDRLDRRPGLVQLLNDAGANAFDVVLVHTLDRWARNLGVALQAINRLSVAHVGLLSINENIDYSTGQGRLNLHILGAFAEFFSVNGAGHIRKARRERYEAGLHNGHPPFGYAPCACLDRTSKSHDRACCGVVIVEDEAQALRDVAGRYAAGFVTLAQAAAVLNALGHRTRHNKRFPQLVFGFSCTTPTW